MKKSELQKLLEYRDFLQTVKPAAPDMGTPAPTAEDLRVLKQYDALKAFEPSPAEKSFQAFESAGIVPNEVNFDTVGEPYKPNVEPNFKRIGSSYTPGAELPVPRIGSEVLPQAAPVETLPAVRGAKGEPPIRMHGMSPLMGAIGVGAAVAPHLMDERSLKEQALAGHQAQQDSLNALLANLRAIKNKDQAAKGPMPDPAMLALFSKKDQSLDPFVNQELDYSRPAESVEAPNVAASQSSKVSSDFTSNKVVPQSKQISVGSDRDPMEAYDRELANAMELRNKSNLLADLGKAGAQMGASIAGLGAGAPVKHDTAILQGISDRAGQPVQDVLTKREQENVRYKLSQQRQAMDPASDMSVLYRSLAKEVMPNLNVNDKMSAADFEKLGLNLSAMYNMKMQNETNRMMASERKQAKADADKDKSDFKLDQQFVQFGNKLNSDLSSARSPIGKEVTRANQANHALKLIEGYKDFNDIPEMQKRELAVALASMISPGLPHESTISQLDPETLQQKLAGYTTAITGKVYGAGGAGIIKNLKKSVERQVDVSHGLIKDYEKKVGETYSHLKKDNPERYERVLQEVGIKVPEKKAEITPVASQKKVVRKGYNAKTNQTQLIYSDGTSEIKPGKL